MKTMSNVNKQIIFNSDLHFEHVQWKKVLLFWKDELKSFQKRLDELAKRWTDKSILVQLEHYQNQFSIQQNAINELDNEINSHEINIASHSKKGVDILNTNLVKNHIECRNKMMTQTTIYDNLKREFFKFLTKYM